MNLFVEQKRWPHQYLSQAEHSIKNLSQNEQCHDHTWQNLSRVEPAQPKSFLDRTHDQKHSASGTSSFRLRSNSFHPILSQVENMTKIRSNTFEHFLRYNTRSKFIESWNDSKMLTILRSNTAPNRSQVETHKPTTRKWRCCNCVQSYWVVDRGVLTDRNSTYPIYTA